MVTRDLLPHVQPCQMVGKLRHGIPAMQQARRFLPSWGGRGVLGQVASSGSEYLLAPLDLSAWDSGQ